MGKITEKSTKAQIMDAYTQALAELEKLKAMSDSPGLKMQRKRHWKHLCRMQK